jgi:hypothetical protein
MQASNVMNIAGPYSVVYQFVRIFDSHVVKLKCQEMKHCHFSYGQKEYGDDSRAFYHQPLVKEEMI